MKYLAALFLLSSCANILNRGQTQYALQQYTRAETLDSHFIVKFNPKTIFNIADTCKEKYVVLTQASSFCPFYRRNLKRLSKITKNDSILVIPLMHDYHYKIKDALDSTYNYSKYKELFFTDRAYFKGGLDPHGTFKSKVYSYYSHKKISDTIVVNLIMKYKNKIIILDVSNDNIKVKSINDFTNNAILIEPKIHFPPNFDMKIAYKDFGGDTTKLRH